MRIQTLENQMPNYLKLNGEFEAAKKLHEILAIAMKDLRAVEKLNRVVVDMSVFWSKNETGECGVCFAGAVIHKRAKGLDKLEEDWAGDAECSPSHFKTDVARKLWALDSLRLGCVGDALGAMTNRAMVLSDPPKTPDREVVDYEEDREKWWEQMRQLRKELKANNE
jgi:hypothetical protein